MPPVRTVTLNGTVEYPADIEELQRRRGVLLEADDGTPTVVQTGSKRGWVLRWNSPLPAVADRIRAVYALTTPVAFVDPYGASYNVVVPVDGFRHTIAHLAGSKVAGTAGGTTEPGLELTVLEV
jgi:hypothetical protein